MVEKRNNAIRPSGGDHVFSVAVYVLMGIFLLIMFYPLYFTLIASFSDINEVGLGNVYLWPKGFTLEAYKNVFLNNQVWVGYANTIVYTIFGTLYGLVLLLPLAYALSKKRLFARRTVTWFFLFTMFFSGGIVPSYILMQKMNLINNRLVMILGGVSVYNMVVVRTFFSSSIPDALFESAKIDGASEFICFFRIALPLSGAIIAVMALYISVSIWNAYFSALIYLTRNELHPLQLVLRNVLILNQSLATDPEFFMLSADEQAQAVLRARMAESMKYSIIYIASAPLLIAYPFIQRFFVKGVMIGSLKG